jgi:asparagine synthase (glutamine-hydrolysing)
VFVLVADPRGGASRSHIAAMAGTLCGGVEPARLWCDEYGRAAAGTRSAGILPEDVFDRQPIAGRDLIFVAAARLDNRDDLLARLGTPRAQWPELADSEVLHRAYRRWAEECVQYLSGDYAFAACHRDSGRVVAAVDHAGSSRLFFAIANGMLVLATQLDALLAHPDVPRELDGDALGLLIAPKIELGSTPFRRVRMLAGGHLLISDGGAEPRLRRWWRPDTAISTHYRDSRDYVLHAKTLFDRAVTAQLRSANGVSAMMSGGLDSTLVAATAAVRLKERGQTIAAYTAVPTPGFACTGRTNWDDNDWPYASCVAAAHDNMEHIAVSPANECPIHMLDAIHRRSRMPVRNAANQTWVGEIARRSAQSGVRVILGGGKGNATISYGGEGAIADLFRRGQWREALRLAPAQGGLRAVARELGGRTIVDLVSRMRGRSMQRDGENCLAPGFRRTHAMALAPFGGFLDRGAMLAFMTSPSKGWSADPLAQWNVEFRDPTADRALIECLVSFPRDAFLAGGMPRGLARAMGDGLVPDSVRLRTTRGTQAPEHAARIAAHAPLYRAAIDRATRSPLYRAIVDIGRVRALLECVCEGRASLSQSAALERAVAVGLFIVGETG